jgi:hypothetical protein
MTFVKGHKHSPETIAKLRVSKSNISDETRRKMRDAKLRNPTRYWLGKKPPPISAAGLLKRQQSMLGRRHTAESRAKMSRAAKGKTAWNKGKTGLWIPTPENRLHMSLSHLGKRHPISEETRRKISLALKGRPLLANKGRFVGSKSVHWKGGVTPEYRRIRKSPQFKSWRESVFGRDKWTCQKHGDVGGKIHPHHILNFAQHPALRFDPNNGVTLCESAHKEFHKTYGFLNNTKKQIEAFIARPL